MDRVVFAARFGEAAEQARAFARTLVSGPLPGKVLFRVRLSQSYPGARLDPGEVTYPGDGGWEQDFALRRVRPGHGGQRAVAGGPGAGMGQPGRD